MTRVRRLLLSVLAGIATLAHGVAYRDFTGLSGFSYDLEGLWPVGAVVAFAVWSLTRGPKFNIMDPDPARTVAARYGQRWSSVPRLIGICLCLIVAAPAMRLVGFFEMPTYVAFHAGFYVIAFAGLVALIGLLEVAYSIPRMLRHLLPSTALLSPERKAGPISPKLIQHGQQTLREAEGTEHANQILARHDLLSVGSRVQVVLSDRHIVHGKVVDAFREESAELGFAEDGVKIRLDDGSIFEEFFSSFPLIGAKITSSPAAPER